VLPIKLTIKGINSYEKEQVIDFSNLLESKVFGIFGKVGSGKSTILEAISYVLYGQTGRMKQGIKYNFMNLKSNRFLIDFEFKADGEKLYRFIVEGKRNSKRFEDVNTKRKYYQWENGKWVPNENLSAEKIIGLSYDNFKMTIIIPQGKFMDFIQLKDADRTKMLKEIFNLQKYDLYDKVRGLSNENNTQIKIIEDNLTRLKDVNIEIIQNKKERLDLLSDERKKITTKLAIDEKELKKLEMLKDSFTELNTKQAKFDQLKLYEESFNSKEKELEEYELCLLNFKPLIDNSSAISEKTNNIQSNLDKTTLEHIQIQEDLKLTSEKYNKIKVEFLNIENYKKKCDEIDKILIIKNIENNIIVSNSQLEKANTELKKNIESKQNIGSKIDNCKIEITKIEKNLPDIATLSEIKSWFNQKVGLEKIINEQKTELNLKKQSIELLKSNKTDIVNKEDQKKFDIDFDININNIITNLENTIKKYEIGIKKLNTKLDSLKIKDKLKEYSTALKEGEPCPVCGSKHHPDIIKIEHLDEEITNLNQRVINGESIIKRIRIYLDQFKELNVNINNEQKYIEQLTNSIASKQKELNTFIKNFKWEKYKDLTPESIEKALEIANNLNRNLVDLRTNYDGLIKRDTEIQGKLDFAKTEMTKAETQLSKLLTEQDILMKQLTNVNYSEYMSLDSKEISTLSLQLKKKIEKIKQDYASLEQRLKDLELEENEYKTKIHGLRKISDELNEEKQELKTKIEAKLSEFSFNKIELVENILKNKLDIDALKKEIADYKLSFETLKNEMKNLKSKLQNKEFDNNKLEQLTKEIKKKKDELENTISEIGSLKNIVLKLEIDLKEKEQFNEKLKEKELRRDDLKVMKNLFTGSGFVNFISTVRLEEVVNYANHRFLKLTKGSMKLELSESNSFNIIDILNGGKRRSIKTLSGGQTFQASLSLALALASIVQQQNRSKQNFFFLDEGFGTQDEESLRLVFNTIKSLRKENRIIGLISHVPELKEEISTYLEIVNDEKEGSMILTSW